VSDAGVNLRNSRAIRLRIAWGPSKLKQDASLRPERILDLSERLSAVAGEKIGEITRVNRAAKMLSINALIVAARAGEAGKGFAIVAEEFKKISTEIDAVAAALESQVRADLDELTAIGGAILGHMRGQRLADLALNAIEIVDRNLYERTCDACGQVVATGRPDLKLRSGERPAPCECPASDPGR